MMNPLRESRDREIGLGSPTLPVMQLLDRIGGALRGRPLLHRRVGERGRGPKLVVAPGDVTMRWFPSPTMIRTMT